MSTNNYKFYIKKENDEYYFGLYPNNNNTQEIGRSKKYKSDNLAFAALEDFRLLVKKNGANAFSLKEQNKKYIFFLKENDYSLEFFRVVAYEKHVNCEKAIAKILKNIDAPFLS